MPWGNAYYNSSLLDGCPSTPGGGYDRGRMPCWAALCNATNAPAQCFNGKKICQHGIGECEGDSMEACAMHAYPSPTLYAPFVYCLEGQHGYWDQQAQKGGLNLSYVQPCAEQAGISAAPILECFNDEALKTSLDQEAARKTAKQAAMVPPSEWGTPFVLVDGKQLQDTDELLRSVCDAWKGQDGAIPLGCVQEYWKKWFTYRTAAALGVGLAVGILLLKCLECICRRCCCRSDDSSKSSSRDAMLLFPSR